MGGHHKLGPITAIGKDQQSEQFIRTIAADNPRGIKPETRANRLPQRLGAAIRVAMCIGGHTGNGGNGHFGGETLKQALGIDFGETSADGRFTLAEAECLGACGDAPVMLVNNKRMCSFMGTERLDALVDELKKA